MQSVSAAPEAASSQLCLICFSKPGSMLTPPLMQGSAIDCTGIRIADKNRQFAPNQDVKQGYRSVLTLRIAAPAGPEREAALQAALEQSPASHFVVCLGNAELNSAAVALALKRMTSTGSQVLQVDIAKSIGLSTTYGFSDYLQYRTYMRASPPSPQAPPSLAHLIITRRVMISIASTLAHLPASAPWHQLIAHLLNAKYGPFLKSPLLLGRISSSLEPSPAPASGAVSPIALGVLAEVLEHVRSETNAATIERLLAAVTYLACTKDVMVAEAESTGCGLSPADFSSHEVLQIVRSIATAQAVSVEHSAYVLCQIAEGLEAPGLSSLEISWAKFLRILSTRIHGLLNATYSSRLLHDALEPLLVKVDWLELPPVEGEEMTDSNTQVDEAILILCSLERTLRQRGNQLDTDILNRVEVLISALDPAVRASVERLRKVDERVAHLRAELAEVKTTHVHPGRVALLISDALKRPGKGTVLLPVRLTAIAIEVFSSRIRSRTRRKVSKQPTKG